VGRPIQTIELERQEGLHRIRSLLHASRQVVLTTHINADGDGAGSEIAVAHYLARYHVSAIIVNPTRFPDEYRFLLGKLTALTPADADGRHAIADADVVLVLDTAEPTRLGPVLRCLPGKNVAVIDHHPPTSVGLGDPALCDPTACATGELVYDLLTADGGRVEPPEARALYVAIVTDTGSFRFANTTPRTHFIAGELLRVGVDPEKMFRHLFGRLTKERLALLQRALASLQVDDSGTVAWIRLSRNDIADTAGAADDTEGLVDYARRLQGVEVALLLRELPDRRSKVSLRSNGEVDVAKVARDFGGGGHVKASGALLDLPLEQAEAAILESVRNAVANLPAAKRIGTP